MRYFYIILFLVLSNYKVFGVQPISDSAKLRYINRIDSMILLQREQYMNSHIEETSKSSQSVFPDMYFEYRLEKLGKTSAIKLDFNADVRKYIDKFLNERKEQVARMMGLKELYFPIFEEYCSKYQLPLELKYLPVLESGLDPLAISATGATGLWQFKLNSAKLLGLTVSSYIDQRNDPYLSTDAACRYLKYLYSMFRDWQLALAAYNGGPGEVRNAIIRSGYKLNFWQLQPYLSEQTRNYVPAFIAAVYVMNYANEHGIKAIKPKYSFFQTDTVWIQEAVSFMQISQKLQLDTGILRFLNPAYKTDYIPDTDEPNLLVLPANKVSAFLNNKNRIYSQQVHQTNYVDKLNNAGNTAGLKKSLYVVQKGDYLHKIALQFGCSVENISAWNNLKDLNLNVGQELIIWQNDSTKTR